MTFELWETRSGNLMAVFATEAEALQVVADSALRLGDGYVDSLSLSSVKKNGVACQIANGPALLTLARGTATRASA